MFAVGFRVGLDVGFVVGFLLVGFAVGFLVGFCVGDFVGVPVVGAIVGNAVDGDFDDGLFVVGCFVTGLDVGEFVSWAVETHKHSLRTSMMENPHPAYRSVGSHDVEKLSPRVAMVTDDVQSAQFSNEGFLLYPDQKSVTAAPASDSELVSV
jgi:hypothetical protein